MALDKVECKCLICGHKWSATPAHLLDGRGCPQCKRNKISQSKLMDPKSFHEIAQRINPGIKVLGKYIGRKKYIQCECMTCGTQWNCCAETLLNSRKCPTCALQSRRASITRTNDNFLDQLFQLHPLINVKTKYVNNITQVECECKSCGHEWTTTPKTLLHGAGCPQCWLKNISIASRKTHDKFISEIMAKNPNIDILSNYVGDSIKVKCGCKTCGLVWSARPNTLLKGVGCPSCAKRSSKGERKIREYLESAGLEYVPQAKFDSLIGLAGRLLSYDFYIPKLNTLIEYQGQYHDGTALNQTDDGFAKQQEHDRRKIEYASQHNINLLEIWYQDFDHIKQILDLELSQYTIIPVSTTA